MATGTDLKNYYAQRAKEYEQIYQKPERQKDISKLKGLLRQVLGERDVLEIACGTGFWTEAIAQTARMILATDVNDAVLEIAEKKPYPKENVKFLLADALTLHGIPDKFNAVFAGFWLSHLPKSQIRDFLENIQGRLSSEGVVVLVDNRFTEGSSTPLHRADENGNTYQLRQLADGSQHEILKNFFTVEDFTILLDGIAENVKFTELEYFWCLSYKPLIA
jgi:ubiquinone/menaquinone biosynthesis C-methylase UbiE